MTTRCNITCKGVHTARFSAHNVSKVGLASTYHEITSVVASNIARVVTQWKLYKLSKLILTWRWPGECLCNIRHINYNSLDAITFPLNLTDKWKNKNKHFKSCFQKKVNGHGLGCWNLIIKSTEIAITKIWKSFAIKAKTFLKYEEESPNHWLKVFIVL